MSSLSKLALLLTLSVFIVYCSKGELNAPPPTTTSTTTTSPSTTTTMSYGDCERGICEEPFCAEDCESPGKCHVKDIDGICYPSCGYLAVLHDDGKYGHYGPDRQKRTEDDPHALVGPHTSCAELDKWGATDWKKIPPFKGRDAHEVVERGGECCGSDQQVELNQQEEE